MMRREFWQMTEEEREAHHRTRWPSVGNPLNTYRDQNVLVGDPDGEPFVVQITEPGCVRASALIFAKNEEDAKARFMTGIREAAGIADQEWEEHQEKEEQNRRWQEENEWKGMHRSRAAAIFRCVEKGWIFCMPFDKRVAARVAWASNDNFI